MAKTFDSLVVRLADMMQRSAPNSLALKQALIRIGSLVSGQAKINITRRALIDTGNLRERTKYEMFNERGMQGVKIGSFGVPYAAVHEFGFQGSVSIRTHQRLMHKVFGREVPPKKITIGPHERFMRIRKRPFLRPAVRKHQNMIVDTIRQALGFTRG